MFHIIELFTPLKECERSIGDCNVNTNTKRHSLTNCPRHSHWIINYFSLRFILLLHDTHLARLLYCTSYILKCRLCKSARTTRKSNFLSNCLNQSSNRLKTKTVFSTKWSFANTLNVWANERECTRLTNTVEIITLTSDTERVYIWVRIERRIVTNKTRRVCLYHHLK